MSLSERDRHIRYLDLMSYQKKSVRWKSEDPVESYAWIPSGPDLDRTDVRTDGQGNILSVPNFAEKPCFGIPTAWLRHAHRKPVYVKLKREEVRNGRCDRCAAATACRIVVVERMRYVVKQNREFRASLTTWAQAGGLGQDGFDVAYNALGRGKWGAVTYPLTTADFADANADYVRSYWSKKKANAADVAAGKQRHRLRQAWKAGDELPVLRKGLAEGAKERAVALHSAASRQTPPDYLRHLPRDSLLRLCNVWWAREFARYTGQDPNSSRLARIAIDEGRIRDCAYSSLRQTIKRNVKVIKKLESNAAYNKGVPVWSKFVHPALASAVT